MLRRGRAVLIGFLVCVVAAAGWYWRRASRIPPVVVDEASLSNWPVIASDGSDPWVVAMKPPDNLVGAFTFDVARRAGRPLAAPPHPALPVVLQQEFSEGLQGVYGTDSVMRMAHEAGLDGSRFEPVCLAHKVVDRPEGRSELYFVPFESAVFSQLRVDLIPAFPEQAGVGIYDPSTLTPILVIGASDTNFERWWPVRFDREADCIGSVTLPTRPQN